jgi:hypothetical protein
LFRLLEVHEQVEAQPDLIEKGTNATQDPIKKQEEKEKEQQTIPHFDRHCNK